MTPEIKIALLENDLKHLIAEFEEVKAIALANQRMLRWGMGAVAGFGALAGLLLPKVAAALGLG